MCVLHPSFLMRSTYCNEITSLQLIELVRLISFLRLICLHLIGHLPQVISSFVTLPPDRHLPCLLCGSDLILAIQSVNIDMPFVSLRWWNQLILHIHLRRPTHWEKIGHGRVEFIYTAVSRNDLLTFLVTAASPRHKCNQGILNDL
jgi:hypothetical protein